MLEYILYKFILGFNKFVVIYVIIISVLNLIQMIIAMVYTPAYMRKVKFSDIKMFSESTNIVPISILVPAFNEEQTIVENIKSLLTLNYVTYEIVVVNDGSEDNTLNAVIDAFALKKVSYPLRSKIQTKSVHGVYYNPEFPRLRLVDKENGGKSDALNAGINISQYPYFASIDADSLLDSDALIRIAMSFMEYKYTIGVGGLVRVANGCKIENGKVVNVELPKSGLAKFQIVEYFRAFLVGRIGWSSLNSLLIISGAFGAFKKSAVLEVGGYTTGSIGEDMDLVLKLHRYMHEKKYKYRISFLPDPVCWTQAPENIRALYSQRRRWHIGLIDSLHRNADMFFRPRFGAVGMISMPYYFLFEMLAPVIEAIGLIVVPLSYFFGILSIEYFILFFIATTLFGVILSVGALAIEEYTFNKYVRLKDVFTLSLYSIIENFSYRQMTVFFRLFGVLRYKKYKQSWGSMKRQAFTPEEQESVDAKSETPV